MIEKPHVEWKCKANEKYSVFLFDLDFMGSKNLLLDEARLWFVANITHCRLYNGEIVVDYLPPMPLSGSGRHRYVILVYKQDEHVYYEEPFIAAK